jgi:hypothetical protein
MPIQKVDQTSAGVATTVTATDTIVTGLPTCSVVVVSLQDDPIANVAYATAVPLTGANAGSFTLKTWNSTLVAAATTFGKKVNWKAFA